MFIFRCKKAPDGKKWSQLVGNLQEGEVLPLAAEDGQIDLSVSMTAHEEEESDEEIDQDNPLWQLFLAAKNLTAPNGELLTNGFDHIICFGFVLLLKIMKIQSTLTAFFLFPDPNYLLCEPFRRLPNRRWHSDYYQEIKNPISMSQIRKKILVRTLYLSFFFLS